MVDNNTLHNRFSDPNTIFNNLKIIIIIIIIIIIRRRRRIKKTRSEAYLGPC